MAIYLSRPDALFYAPMDSFSSFASPLSTETAPHAPTRASVRRTAIGGTPTRERILTAAAQLFAEHGFASASMPAIAELSGITAGASYRHFVSKAELWLEV